MSTSSAPGCRLGLGTAQFGLAYGISNQTGRVGEAEAGRIICRAVEAGVGAIDTAPAYGDAERVVASALSGVGRDVPIVTKTVLLAEGLDRVVARARASHDLFGRPIDLIVHSAGDLAGASGEALWAALQDLKAEGICRRIGFSAYVEDGVSALAERFRPDIVQVPCSLADQRLARDGTLAQLRAEGIVVHIRSVFLQGLVLMEPDRLPSRLAGAAPWLISVRRLASEAGLSMLEAALAYVWSLPDVLITVGVTSLREFDEILAASAAHRRADFAWDAWAMSDEALLSPSKWKDLGL